jgi:hypothetical protein
MRRVCPPALHLGCAWRRFGVLAALAPLTIASVANAANLNINDAVEGEITVAQDANWEFGVNNNGTIFGGNVAGSVTVPGEMADFSGEWLVNAPGSPDPGEGIIYFVDPDFPDVVRAIVRGTWSTLVQAGLDRATITLEIDSSACGDDLGPLPPQFAGLGIPVPEGSIGIGGAFREPASAASVSIPTNLTIQYVGAPDADCDGVLDSADVCAGTIIPEGVPTKRLGVNRFALTDDDGDFDTTTPRGRGPEKSFTIEETAGCSCEQIIDELGLGAGHTTFGCSISAMEEWVQSLNP